MIGKGKKAGFRIRWRYQLSVARTARPSWFLWTFLLFGLGLKTTSPVLAGEKIEILKRSFSHRPAAAVTSLVDRTGYESSESTHRALPPGRALLMSFVIPGWGQWTLGHKKAAAFFLASEALLWITAGSYATLSDWKENDYRLYAVTHAAVNPAGKDKQFYVNIGNYDSLDDYNQAKLRARNLRDYHRDRESYYWNWDSPTNRAFYEQLRVASDRYANRAELMLGGVLANHLISGLHALWVSRRRETQMTSRGAWDWYAQVLPYPRLSVSARF